jgi:hypothetical protein
VSGHSELRLEVFGQKSVKASHGENVKNATSSSEEEDVVLQEPPDGFGEIFQTGILVSHG